MTTARLPSLPAPPETLDEVLERAAERFAHRGVSLLDNRGRLIERRPFDLLRDSLKLAARRYARLGLGSGERILLCLPTSMRFLEMWYGAHLAGGLPIAIATPGAMGSPSGQLERVRQIARRLRVRWVVCPEALAGEIEREDDDGPLPTLTAERFAEVEPAASAPRPPHDPDATAFLQLTSGSTGSPRAVQIPQRAAIHNNIASSEAIGRPHGRPAWEWADSLVSWLPLYHDMGLVGGVLFSLVNGFELVLMSPRSFLARPWLWLEAAGRSGRVISPAPNFAYQMCVERLGRRRVDGLDLSGWTSALTGSEMVRPETMAAFCDTFARYGFEPQFARPCYGMAEATLSVTFDCRAEGIRTRPVPPEADRGLGLEEVVSNGLPIIDTEVEIAAPDGGLQPAGRVGEVRIKGPGIFSGYFEDPAATRESLRDGWLYTGDLGFLDADGELYLTGRLKDILILNGQNVMPHDLEWIAEEVVGGGGSLRSGAFSVARPAAGEQAIVVLESSERNQETLESLRHEVSSRIGRRLRIPVADLVLVRRGSIPKTSSGKVQRRLLRQRYLDGELDRLEV